MIKVLFLLDTLPLLHTCTLDQHKLHNMTAIAASMPSDSERSDLPVRAAYFTDDEVVHAEVHTKEEKVDAMVHILRHGTDKIATEALARLRIGESVDEVVQLVGTLDLSTIAQQHNCHIFGGKSIIAKTLQQR